MQDDDPRDTRKSKISNKQLHAYISISEQVFTAALTQKLRDNGVSFSEINGNSIEVDNFIALTAPTESTVTDSEAYKDIQVLIVRNAHLASQEVRDQIVKLINACTFIPHTPTSRGTAGNFLIYGKECSVFVASRPGDNLQDLLFYSILEVIDSNR